MIQRIRQLKTRMCKEKKYAGYDALAKNFCSLVFPLPPETKNLETIHLWKAEGVKQCA